MNQTLQANVSIVIPSDFVLIEKSEYENLVTNNDVGKWWTFKDLQEFTNRKDIWLRTNILEVPKYRRVLDVRNGGFVKYPEGGKSGYLILASKMKKFLEENFSEILK